MATAGTLRKLQLDGNPFNMPADIDLAEMVTQEVTGIPSTGETMFQVVKKVPERDGVVVLCDDDDWILLQELAARASTGDPFPCSYTNSAGVTYTGPAHINIEQRQTAENKATLKLIPSQGWSRF